MSKEPGKRSQQQNDFLEPGTPINVVATNVGTDRPYNDGAVSLSFSTPEGSPPADLFTVTVFRGATTQDLTAQGTTGTSSPIVITGLDSNVSYRFTISASNATGATPESESTPLVLVTTVPATPAAPSIQNFSNDQQDYLTWSHPINGGSTLLTYTWESTDNKTGTVNYNGITAVVAQEGGTQQQYRIRVTNANGTSEWSPYSVTAFTPPFFPPFFPFFPPFFPFFPFFPPMFPFFPFFPPMFPFFPFFPPRFPFFPFFPPRFPFFPFFPPRFPFFPPFFPFFPPSFKRRRCLAAETPILTANGTWVPARSMQVGDKLKTVSSEHIDMVKLADSKLSANLPENVTLVETEIISIEVKSSVLVGFNGGRGMEKRYSVTQPMLVETVDGLTYIEAGEIKLGDILVGVLEDGRVTRNIVETIELDEVESEVYDIRTSPQPWIITESYMVIS
jgi:hypothetical protein